VLSTYFDYGCIRVIFLGLAFQPQTHNRLVAGSRPAGPTLPFGHVGPVLRTIVCPSWPVFSKNKYFFWPAPAAFCSPQGHSARSSEAYAHTTNQTLSQPAVSDW